DRPVKVVVGGIFTPATCRHKRAHGSIVRRGATGAFRIILNLQRGNSDRIWIHRSGNNVVVIIALQEVCIGERDGCRNGRAVVVQYDKQGKGSARTTHRYIDEGLDIAHVKVAEGYHHGAEFNGAGLLRVTVVEGDRYISA